MFSASSSRYSSRAQRLIARRRWLMQEWLTVLAIFLWAMVFLSYWLQGRLGLLIHPNYFALAIAAGFLLLAVSGWQSWRLWRGATAPMQHVTLLPPAWTLAILIVAAVISLLITPRPFNSDTAIHRGLDEGLTVTRNSPATFRLNQRPEDRTLIDWVRTLDVYPEPDAYAGLPAKIDGFAVHSRQLPDNYLTLTRFVITCCAADAYPVGLPVKLPQPRQAYPQDQWFRVEGQMATETLGERRQLVLVATTITPIPEPDNPFMY
ncbi:TIGR03943 family putative permease subunit [Parathermosynechococcus lividus]